MSNLTEIEKLFFDNLEKVCINKYPVKDNDRGYRHPDLYKLWEKAKEEGKDCFYAKGADGPKEQEFNQNYGHYHMIECEPVYMYHCLITLSEEEYNELVKNKQKEIVDGLTDRLNKLWENV